MCGIAGIVGKNDPSSIQRMRKAMHHRGPDDSGIFLDNCVSLGMTRLAILDLSYAGHQPMGTPDGRYWIVYNGEMYNFVEERKRLEKHGIKFSTNTDTEVVLRLYEMHGQGCLDRIRGMFAFAIWDKLEQRLFAARDPMGIKPLYYSSVGDLLLFASEIKALLASGLMLKEIEVHALYQFLLIGYVLPPRSMVKNVKILEPGYYFIWCKGKLNLEKYWDLSTKKSSDRKKVSYGEAKEQIRTQLFASVKEQLVSDVPLGVFLSGGLDSAVVTACMAEATSGSIECFSMGFEQSKDVLDETDNAMITARHFGANFHKLIISGRDISDNFDDFINALDQPSVDGLNTYFVSKFAKSDVTVALCGLGGDELFAGYSRAWRIASEQTNGSLWRTWLAGFLSSNASALLPYYIKHRLQYEADKRDILSSYALASQIFTSEQVSNILAPNFVDPSKKSLRVAEEIQSYDDPSLKDPISRVSRLDLKTFMAGRLLRDMDAVSMSHSLEVRFPLIDKLFVSYAFSLPSSFKHSLNGNKKNQEFKEGNFAYAADGIKRILFDAFSDCLPPQFGQRNKMGFRLPFENWLKTNLSSRIEATFNSEHSAPFLNTNGLRHLWKAFQQRKVGWAKIWLILILDSWYHQVFNGKIQ